MPWNLDCAVPGLLWGWQTPRGVTFEPWRLSPPLLAALAAAACHLARSALEQPACNKKLKVINETAIAPLLAVVGAK
jgi:predicted nicotinamide N-methyase